MINEGIFLGNFDWRGVFIQTFCSTANKFTTAISFHLSSLYPAQKKEINMQEEVRGGNFSDQKKQIHMKTPLLGNRSAEI